MPFAPTGQHAPPVGFGGGETLFAWAAKLKWKAAAGTYEKTYKAAVDARREEWGLALAAETPYTWEAPPLTIMGYSPALCPPPTDWDKAKVYVVGSLVEGVRASTAEYEPPAELHAPLGLAGGGGGGKKPVVFTFGSSLGALKRGEQATLLSACVRAAGDVGLGAIIFTAGCFGGKKKVAPEDEPLPEGWAKHLDDATGNYFYVTADGTTTWDPPPPAAAEDTPPPASLLDDAALGLLAANPAVVLFDGDCPHDWLFPRASAVCCHGGAGTVHACVAAGVPCVVSPCQVDDTDQAWWGGCVAKAGVGRLSQPTASHKSGSTLAKDLRAVLGLVEEKALEKEKAEGPAVAAKCQALAAALRAESGAQGAARIVLAEAEKAVAAKGGRSAGAGAEATLLPAVGGLKLNYGENAKPAGW